MSENLTPEQMAYRFQLAAEELVAHALRHGLKMRVTIEPGDNLHPTISNPSHKIDVQPAPPAPRIGRPDQNHGWVTPRADGRFAKCGGPAMCADCLAEQLEKQSHQPPQQTSPNIEALASSRATPLPPKVITGSTPRPIGDREREWAAQPANLREGCTVHVPGVGDL